MSPSTVAKIFEPKVRVIKCNHPPTNIDEKANGASPVLTLTTRDPLLVKPYSPSYGPVNTINLDMRIRRTFNLFYLNWIEIFIPFKRIQV